MPSLNVQIICVVLNDRLNMSLVENRVYFGDVMLIELLIKFFTKVNTTVALNIIPSETWVRSISLASFLPTIFKFGNFLDVSWTGMVLAMVKKKHLILTFSSLFDRSFTSIWMIVLKYLTFTPQSSRVLFKLDNALFFVLMDTVVHTCFINVQRVCLLLIDMIIISLVYKHVHDHLQALLINCSMLLLDWLLIVFLLLALIWRLQALFYYLVRTVHVIWCHLGFFGLFL